ncbi:MAG: nucleoside hydrolase [Anaerolineae bacterium]|nr:nucleoside hydrolase [Anaerolineae bacterium]
MSKSPTATLQRKGGRWPRFRLLIFIGIVLCLGAGGYILFQQANRDRSPCPRPLTVTPPLQYPVPVILDTDFAEDVDDVGALAILHAMADKGQAEILGVMISSGNRFAPRAVDTINTYYGRPDIPVGVAWEPVVSPESRYTFELAFDFPNDIVGVPEAVDLYREILAQQPNGSVTIVSVGFLTNLRALLRSESDAHSVLNGSDLVAAKVRQLVVMGGHYPDSSQHPAGKEYNFALDSVATYDVIPDWPTPIIFVGFEAGVDVVTGVPLQTDTPEDNPVRRAYWLFNRGAGRSSWDLITVYVAVQGSSELWAICPGGYNEVSANGSNRWIDSPQGNHGFLVQLGAREQIEKLLNDLLIQPPRLVE